MSKSYKLKRAYTILKALAAVGIGGLTLNGFISLSSGSTSSQDILTVVVGSLVMLYFAASYSKADMEKDDLMEKVLKLAEKNKAWVRLIDLKLQLTPLRLPNLRRLREVNDEFV